MASSNDGWVEASLEEPSRNPAAVDGWIEAPLTASSKKDDGWVEAKLPAVPSFNLMNAISGIPQDQNNYGGGHEELILPENKTPTKEPTEEEIKNQIKLEQSHDQVLGEMGSMVGKVVEPTLRSLQVPVNVVANVMARGRGTLDALTTYNPIKAKDVVEGFLNPESLKKYRTSSGSEARIQDIYSQIVSSDAPTSDKMWGLLSTTVKEITPNILPADTLSDDDNQTIVALTPDFVKKAIGTEGTKSLAHFALNAALDPLMYSKFMSAVTPAARGAIKGVEELTDAEKIAEGFKNAAAKPAGLGPETARGEKALYQFILPGMQKPLLTIKGQTIMEGLDEIGTTLEAKTHLRPLMQKSGFTGFDVADDFYHLEGAANASRQQKAKTLLLSSGQPSEKVIRYISNVAEHGEEVGTLLSKKQGIKLTTDEMLQARELTESYKALNEEGNRAIVLAGGRDLSVRTPITLEQQQAAIDYAKKKYGDIPSIILKDGDKSYDLTFPQGKDYDFGRALTEEAKEARRVQKAVDEFSSGTKSSGYSTTANSQKARAEFSTQVMNTLLEKEYGVKEAFNPNKSEVVLNNFQNKLDVSRKLKFFNFTKEKYGLLEGDIQQVIDQAQGRVEFARSSGFPPAIEDLRMSKMTKDDFRPLKGKLWNDIKPYYSAPKAEGEAATVFLQEKELFYPKAIADRIEMKFYQPSQSKLLQTVNWYQRQKSMNMLTSFLRPGKQAVENLFKLLSLRVAPQDVIEELAIAGRAKSKDVIARLADEIPVVNETVGTLKDFKKDVKLSLKMLTDPEVNAGVDAFYGALHEGAKQGKLDKVLFGEMASKVLSSPKKAIEFMNENPVSSAIRHMGNFSDGLAKRAYFRSLIKQGYDAAEAARMVGDHLMDFGSGTQLQKGMRYALPFASFHLKNLETMIPLIAMRPGITNLTNPYNGYLKRAIEDYSGWNPGDYKALQKALPYYRNPVLGPILRGQTTLLEEKNRGKAVTFLNDYVAWALGPKAKEQLSSGLQLSLMIPTNIQAALDITDLSRANENFASPFIAAAGMGLLGYDMYRGQTIPTKGTPMENTDEVVGALRTLNPVDYPKFMNGVLVPLIEKAMPSFRQRLQEGPLTRHGAEVLKLKLGADAPLKGLKVSQDTVNAMTNTKFFGMGRLDKADFTFFMQQMALMRTLGDVDKLIDKKFEKESREEGLRAIGSFSTIVKQINDNTKIYNDYRARMMGLGGTLDPETRLEIEKTPKFEENEEYNGLEEVPIEPAVRGGK